MHDNIATRRPMITYLPEADYAASAACLDTKRLNKQISECYYILDKLEDQKTWFNLAIVRMWKLNRASLVDYSSKCYAEFTKRGEAPEHGDYHKLLDRWGRDLEEHPIKPVWLGDPRFHLYHKSNLLRLGMIDVLKQRCKAPEVIKRVGKPIYLERFCRGHLGQAEPTADECFKIQAYFNSEGIKDYPNWYDQFGWQDECVEPGEGYYWPA